MVFLKGVGINREIKKWGAHLNGMYKGTALRGMLLCLNQPEKLNGYNYSLSSKQFTSCKKIDTYLYTVGFILQSINSTFSSICISIKHTGNCFPQFVPEKLRIRPGPIRGAP